VLLAMETSSEAERSAVVGGVTAFVDVALSLGAFTLGAVAAVTGYAGAFLVASIVALGGLLVVVPRRRSERIALEEGTP
jgi:predicted MFS family arabinose efflux permease